MAAILALPLELYHLIAFFLSYNSLQALRLTCRTLFTSVLPTHSQLLDAEIQPWAQETELLTCIGCLRLRHKKRFSTNKRNPPPPPYMDLIPYDFVSAAMMLSNVVPAFPPSPSQPAKGTLPEHRLCNACGVRDLPGKHRYQLGERWDDEFGIWHVRCVRCEKIKVAQREKGEVCFGCWSEETEGERGEKNGAAWAVEE